MHSAVVTGEGDRIRWVELAGEEPARVYLHGLGATSPAYFAAAATHPRLAGRRSLLLDLLGHGHSDRPEEFPYTLEAHADAVADALIAAEVAGAEVIAHSMGGAVAIVLAHRHPGLVSRLVLVDANLDPAPRPVPGAPVPAGSSGISRYSEEEFLAGGWAEVRERAGEHWWATMRLAGRTALYRSAVHLAAGTKPTMRELLVGLRIPRAFLYPAEDGALAGAAELEAAGVCVVPVDDCGHNIMLDVPDAFAEAAAAALGTAVYVLDGRRIGTLEDFWREIGEAVNGPEGYFGGNLDALNDCLRGGFGTPDDDDFRFEWYDHARSRERLGHAETARQLELRLTRCHPANRERVAGELAAARRGEGPTVFDWLIEIMEGQAPGALRLR